MGKNVTSRRTAIPARARSAGTHVRLTPEEKRELMILAANQGLSLPALLLEAVRAVRDGESVGTRRQVAQELLAVRRLLANVANNVNQIAAAVNSGQDLPGVQLDAELVLLRRLAGRIESAVKELVA